MPRDLSNATNTITPLVRGGLSRASILFASTADTRNLLPLEKKRLSSHHWESERSYWAHRVRGIKHHQGCFTLAGFSIGRGSHRRPGLRDAFEKIPNAQFTIVGSGPEEVRLKADALARKIKDSVDFILWLLQNNLFELYDSHDLLLFPSLPQ